MTEKTSIYNNLKASLLLKLLNVVFSTKSITQLGFVLLYSLKIQPIALLIKNSLDKTCQILVGSIRQTKVIREAFAAGADIVTIQNDSFVKMLNQQKSLEANLLFQKDWNKK